MVRNQGINLYLAPFDDISNVFREYPVTATSPGFTANATEAYIEAVDGERFVVVVDLGEEFEAKGSARLRIECFIDGEFISKQVSPYVLLKTHLRVPTSRVDTSIPVLICTSTGTESSADTPSRLS
jgi:hypothetical protein